jgi:hypothetical protein
MDIKSSLSSRIIFMAERKECAILVPKEEAIEAIRQKVMQAKMDLHKKTILDSFKIGA